MTSKTSALVIGVGPEQGLGAALCRRFAKEDMKVFACGRTAVNLDAVCASIASENGEAIPIVTDVTEVTEVENMINLIRESKSPLELAVYNAGNNFPQPFLDVTPKIFSSMWKVLCFGGFLASQAIIRLMLEQTDIAPRQSLLFTGASGSRRGKSGFSAFASGKGALRMLSQSLAREFGPQSIHVAHVIIDGVINGDKVVKGFPEYAESLGKDGLLDLDAIAENYWNLHRQHNTAWTQEIDLRPYKENF